ncbi:MAG: ribulokinase [Candidatus Omnitrophota bacterium]
MKKQYSLGLDFGTNSVRALLVELSGGKETATFIWNYRRGKNGVIVSANDPLFARQHPADYVEGTGDVVKGVIKEAKKNDPDFTPDKIIGIGVDTTGSTPIPVDKSGRPLAFNKQFSGNPNSYAWLWKDHTSAEEAEEITSKAKKNHPEYLRRCGGRYSSEWFFAKILHLSRVDKKVFRAAESFVELEDFIPALLADNLAPKKLKRGICAAGHKALYCSRWNGLPSEAFLVSLSPNFKGLRNRLYEEAYPAGDRAGRVSRRWAQELGLKEGIAVSVGAFDAHLGAVGAGIEKNGLVKVIGTSTCDLMVFPADNERRLEKIEGMCGLAESSIIPGSIGLEAGQSAVGDIFAWFAENCVPANYSAAAEKSGKDIQAYLSEKAARLAPGESGLLALDWNNGNRSVLVDQKLSGLLLGQTLATRPEEIYRALIEATGFGARTIIDRIEKSGENIKKVITCGGIPKKNPLLMQTYSNILNRPLKIAASEQTCALGAALVGAVAAGREAGGFSSVEEGQKVLCRFEAKEYRPDKKSVAAYQKLYRLYGQLHDAFGRPDSALFSVMKELMQIK